MHAIYDGKLTDYSSSSSRQAYSEEWLAGLNATTNPFNCEIKDKPLGYSPFPEIQPYFVPQVGRTSLKVQLRA